MFDISKYEVKPGEVWRKPMRKIPIETPDISKYEVKRGGAQSVESEKPDYETQLAINGYKRLRSGLGFGTLSRLQRIIELIPLTKKIQRESEINPLDDDD